MATLYSCDRCGNPSAASPVLFTLTGGRQQMADFCPPCRAETDREFREEWFLPLRRVSARDCCTACGAMGPLSPVEIASANLREGGSVLAIGDVCADCRTKIWQRFSEWGKTMRNGVDP